MTVDELEAALDLASKDSYENKPWFNIISIAAESWLLLLKMPNGFTFWKDKDTWIAYKNFEKSFEDEKPELALSLLKRSLEARKKEGTNEQRRIS